MSTSPAPSPRTWTSGLPTPRSPAWRRAILRCESGAPPPSLRKRRVRHEVDRRRRPVSMQIPFAEIADEIVVGRLRLRPGDMAEAAGHAPLHVEARELLHDPRDLRRRDELVLQA